MTKFHITDRLWLLILFAIWTPIITVTLWPPSWWFVVRSMTVMDAPVGESPKFELDRTIHRDFFGEWQASVKRKGPGGGFHTVPRCNSTGDHDYLTTTSLPPPDKRDLNWWLFPVKCELLPGEYRLDTVWTIHPNNFPSKQVRVNSNIFTIYTE